MRAWPCAALLGLLLTAPGGLLAASPGVGGEPSSAPVSSNPSVATGAASKRGVRSPALDAYDQALLAAHRILAEGSDPSAVDSAVSSYRQVIALEPSRPDAYLYLGGVLFQKQELTAAKDAWTSAEARARSKASWSNQRGKALFMLAMVEEILSPGEESAKRAWSIYVEFAQSNPDRPAIAGSGEAGPMVRKVFPESGASRMQRLEERRKLASDYQRVRELVAKRQKELGIGPSPAGSASPPLTDGKSEPKPTDGNKK